MNCYMCNKEIDKPFSGGMFATDKEICISCHTLIMNDDEFIKDMSVKVYDSMWDSFTDLPTNKIINDNVFSNDRFKKLCEKIIKDNYSRPIPNVSYGNLKIE